MFMRSGFKINDFKSGTSIRRFSSVGAASTAVKGLMLESVILVVTV